MKELSIEEKAKRYDNIIEKANKMHHENCEACQMCIEELIPELAEPEDERIRKALIENFKFFGGEYLKTSKWGKNDDLLVTDILAWLEKQGEHAKFRESIQIGDEVTRNKDGMLVNLSQLKRVAKPNESKQGEQKPYGQRKECKDCQMNYAGECKGSCAMKRGEQKPADKVEPKFKKE